MIKAIKTSHSNLPTSRLFSKDLNRLRLSTDMHLSLPLSLAALWDLLSIIPNVHQYGPTPALSLQVPHPERPCPTYRGHPSTLQSTKKFCSPTTSGRTNTIWLMARQATTILIEETSLLKGSGDSVSPTTAVFTVDQAWIVLL
jgi:hypothetical protein